MPQKNWTVVTEIWVAERIDTETCGVVFTASTYQGQFYLYVLYFHKNTNHYLLEKVHQKHSLLLVQVASSEWVLGVQLQHFENPKNAAWRLDKYCCCDIFPLVCEPTITSLDQQMCTDECETHFVIHVRDCPYNQTCSVTKRYELEEYDDLYLLSKAGIFILFGNSKLSNEVRMKDVTY